VTNDDNHATDASFDHFRIQRSSGQDTTPPSVSAAADGVPTASGSFLNHATVKVTATDLGSGVESVEYAVGDGAFAPTRRR